MGDGESDEPEALGALSLAAREGLDNLMFVVNCNLQRLDGPVRGNGKIIQELEGKFRGAGWQVIKVLWGSEWDRILARDTEGLLLQKFGAMVDGDFQTIHARGPAYLREKIIGDDPALARLVEGISDAELWQMSRGGHDPRKVYAAFAAARKHRGQPTVILMQTIKGFGMGQAGESVMVAHNVKKMDVESLKVFRDRFHVPLKDEELAALPFIKPPEDSPEARFLRERRQAMGGPVPFRDSRHIPLVTPPLADFSGLLESSGEREISTTMAFVRLLTTLVRDKQIGKQIVPIVPDEARTFGMEGLFRQLGIYAPFGQLYEPQDGETVAWYREDVKGPDPGGGHHRGRVDLLLAGRRHRPCQLRRADDPLLHLLFDVRLPADRRSVVGCGRQPGQGLSHGGHLGTDHPQRRGPAASGRPGPASGLDHP
jgi:pyruvate dehydrogenase E1 component